MKTWIKASLITSLFGVPAFVLGPVIWPPAAHGPELSAAQLPFAIAIFAIEALGFGLGISFLALGLPTVRRAAAGAEKRAWATYLSIGWLLVSWWPHDNLHMHVGEDPQSLLFLTYGFHLTLLISGLVLALSFLSTMRQQQAAPIRQEGARDRGSLAIGRVR
jgi:hypothetical protein